MALFKIVNPTIKVIPAGKQNAGKKYLWAQLINVNCLSETPRTYTNFSEFFVGEFAKYLSITHGGTQQEDKELPPELATIRGEYREYIPEQKFYKQHLTAHPARPATPTSPARDEIKVGDIVSKNGIPIVYSSLVIFVEYYIDEMGNKAYKNGELPTQVGQRAFQSYCVPVKEDNTPQPTPQSEATTEALPY